MRTINSYKMNRIFHFAVMAQFGKDMQDSHFAATFHAMLQAQLEAKARFRIAKRGGVSELVTECTKEFVENAYRNKAKQIHPDRGGSQEEMQLLNAAVAWLRSIIEEKTLKQVASQ